MTPIERMTLVFSIVSATAIAVGIFGIWQAMRRPARDRDIGNGRRRARRWIGAAIIGTALTWRRPVAP